MANPAPIAFAGMRIGLLGGSFDPAHDGHMAISLLALKHLRLDKIWWLVSPQNPLKDKSSPFEQRLSKAVKMARHPDIVVTGIEKKFGTHFTADTLQMLKIRYRGTGFVWIMGADNLVQLHRWRNWVQIFQTVPIAVFDRRSNSPLHSRAAIRFARQRIDAGDAAGLVEQKPPAWMFMHSKLAPQSSSELRLSLSR